MAAASRVGLPPLIAPWGVLRLWSCYPLVARHCTAGKPSRLSVSGCFTPKAAAIAVVFFSSASHRSRCCLVADVFVAEVTAGDRVTGGAVDHGWPSCPENRAIAP